MSFNKKSCLFLVLFIVEITSVFSQNEITYDEHAKYWYYRKKLKDKFVNIGLQDPVGCTTSGGQSIPATRYDGGQLYYNEDNLMWFGQYLGVLATEYKLLHDNGKTQEANKTKEELYYAMMAYERLDRKSETLPYIFASPTPTPSCNSGVNGFFIRGDVAVPDWYNVGYNYTATEADCANQTHIYNDCGYGITPGNLWEYLENQHPDFYSQYNSVHDDPTMDYFYRLKCCERLADDNNISWLANQLDITENDASKWGKMNFYPTQDQIASLFMGFALVKKCMGNTTYNGYHFRDKAVNYTHLIATYLSENDWLGKLEDGTPHQWGRTFRHEMGFGLVLAASSITGESYIKPSDVQLLELSIAYWGFLNDLIPVSIAFMANKSNYHSNFVQIYAAISDGWAMTGLNLSTYGAVTDQGINSLLHAFLHDKSIPLPLTKGYFKDRIEDAPCKGPRYRPIDDPFYVGVNGWSGVNRWWHPSNQFDKKGHFNGLDYMILFNLYNLVYTDEAFNNYHNAYEGDRVISGVIPLISPTCGKQISYGSFNNITVENAILTNGVDLTLKAQNSIKFGPGFVYQSECGGTKSKLHAYIGNLNCTDNPTKYFRQSQPTGELEEAKEIEEKIEIFSRPINIQPNPTTGFFRVHSSENIDKILVVDMYGKQIYSHSTSGNAQNIDLSTQNVGIYFVHITSSNETIIKKVVKQ